MRPKRPIHSATALVALLVTMQVACDRKAPTGQAQAGARPRGPLSFPVEVMTVAPQALNYVLTAPGTIEAFETVQVTARVAGVVDRVRFQEGDQVKSARSLVAIEPERYSLAVAAARATLEKARAGTADAEAGVQRREAAVAKSPGLIPGEEVATWRTRVRTASAEVAAAEAALAQAELNLRDAYVRAPISGTIETRTVQTGQYVQPGSVLATLVRRDPLLLRFNLSASQAGEVRVGMNIAFTVPGKDTRFEARVTHVAEAADQASRMVILAAQIQSQDAALRPGGFAQVTVTFADRRIVPAIPETAIRPSEEGFVAYVVEKDHAVRRILQLGLRTPDGMVEVKSGLVEGEQVVVRGAEALIEGASVRVEAAAKAPVPPTSDQPPA